MSDAPRAARRLHAPGWLTDESTNGTPARRQVDAAASDEHDASQSGDSRARVPRLTLPSLPALQRVRRAAPPVSNESAKRRTVMAGATARQSVVHPPASDEVRTTRNVPAMQYDEPERRGTREPYAPSGPWRDWDDWDASDDSGAWDDWTDGDNLDAYEDDGADQSRRLRRRGRTAARPLALERVSDPSLRAIAPLDLLDEPEQTLSIARPRSADLSERSRARLDTRALVRTARSPWSLARFALALLAICVALWSARSAAGEPSQPLMATWQTTSGTHDARAITSLVQPETQGMRPDLYDSNAQFQDWWDAACSAAVSSEVLTAWGAPHATIGKLIDVMQPDISLDGGLLTMHGFVRAASAFGFRADTSSSLTYNQMLYLTNTLGVPVIVNVRISYGYYHFFSGGHFLVVTGGDSQGLRIVDSSEYYIKYLPRDTFESMFTGITAVIVPNGYSYTLPPG